MLLKMENGEVSIELEFEHPLYGDEESGEIVQRFYFNPDVTRMLEV